MNPFTSWTQRRAAKKRDRALAAYEANLKPSARELFPVLLERLERSRPIDIATGRRDMKAKPAFRNVIVDGRHV